MPEDNRTMSLIFWEKEEMLYPFKWWFKDKGKWQTFQNMKVLREDLTLFNNLPKWRSHRKRSTCDHFILLNVELHLNNQKDDDYKINKYISSVQSLSCVRLFATPWIAARQASLFITNSRSSLKLMSIESVMPSSHLILCCPLLLLPPIPPRIRVFFNESTPLMTWPKNWSFSFSISPSNEHPGLISFRMDWLDLLAVQGILK